MLRNMDTAPVPTLTIDTQLLLLKQDLKTERLLVEVEPLVLAIANQQATEAALLDRLDSGSI